MGLPQAQTARKEKGGGWRIGLNGIRQSYFSCLFHRE